jgi:hypothetical protein
MRNRARHRKRPRRQSIDRRGSPSLRTASRDTLRAVAPRLLDLVTLAMLVLAAGAFLMGARALADKQDILAIYWLIVGAALARATSNAARAERAGG